MTESDYTKQNFNTFFAFNYYRETKIYQTKYFFLISIVCFVLCSGFLIIWFIKIKILDPVHIITLQKIIIILPVVELLVNIAIFLDLTALQKQSSSSTTSGSSYKVYIETALITLNAVFRTLLWFMIMLIIYGWQITKQNLNREEMKFFIKIYVFMYIIMFIDQLLDLVIKQVFVFRPSEIKNTVLYIILLVWLTKRGVKSLKFLKNKLIYASIVSREFIPALKLKLKIVK